MSTSRQATTASQAQDCGQLRLSLATRNQYRRSNWSLRRKDGVQKTHLVSVRIEERLQIDDVGVGDESHDLQFTVLHTGEKERGTQSAQAIKRSTPPDLPPMVGVTQKSS